MWFLYNLGVDMQAGLYKLYTEMFAFSIFTATCWSSMSPSEFLMSAQGHPESTLARVKDKRTR
jgi:hypothetical protein